VTDPVWAITALTALAFFLPSFFAGVPAPVLAQIAVTTQDRSGPALGAMFASGAVGAIAGTLLAGFVFISWLGLHADAGGRHAGLRGLGALVHLAGPVAPPRS
jgi:hypothetical protein